MNQFLSPGSPRRSPINLPMPPREGKPGGRDRIIPEKASGSWLWLCCPQMDLPQLDLQLEQNTISLGGDHWASKGHMDIPPVWHGPALPCLLFTLPRKPTRLYHPGRSFQDEEHEVKPEDLQNHTVLSDFREFGDGLFGKACSFRVMVSNWNIVGVQVR